MVLLTPKDTDKEMTFFSSWSYLKPLQYKQLTVYFMCVSSAKPTRWPLLCPIEAHASIVLLKC